MKSIFEGMLKNIDPVVAHILNEALDSKDISVKQAVELFDSRGPEINAISMVADMLRKCSVGDLVTYVVNRNINFTNV
ncbi:MAG TPA: 7,8-didemethyl-8-hydroxy-5-deazariboflavin synthase subunit CofH, partial [Nitrososphaeraceae archaeon]|nr:7,8-didemethyl-8-hydroxy-5-deazariboflavin synthase subunit CofH [Nitrososphaeraceae archaeon]